MKVVVAFNKEKALVGTFSKDCKRYREISLTALVHSGDTAAVQICWERGVGNNNG